MTSRSITDGLRSSSFIRKKTPRDLWAVEVRTSQLAENGHYNKRKHLRKHAIKPLTGVVVKLDRLYIQDRLVFSIHCKYTRTFANINIIARLPPIDRPAKPDLVITVLIGINVKRRQKKLTAGPIC